MNIKFIERILIAWLAALCLPICVFVVIIIIDNKYKTHRNEKQLLVQWTTKQGTAKYVKATEKVNVENKKHLYLPLQSASVSLRDKRGC